MSKGSQKKRPVDPDLQEVMAKALSPEGEGEGRKPWFLNQGYGAESAPVVAGGFPASEEWRKGGFQFVGEGGAQYGEVLCHSQRPGSLIPVAPVVVDGCYVLSRQYGEDPVTYTYARCEAVQHVTIGEAVQHVTIGGPR